MHLRDGIQTHPTVAQRYAHLVDGGVIRRDPAQEAIVADLDRVLDTLAARRGVSKSSALGWLFARKPEASEPIRGLYIHGGVGRGKTMLMDMFFELAPLRLKRRVHFNDFMADAHDRIQKHRQARKDGTVREDDPIPPVARQIAEAARLLCFDEFSVTDIADAMILSRLFSALFSEGVVLVATSNVAPDELYADGLNRGLFLPFITLLKRHTAVASLDSDTDYRLEKLNRIPVYMTPLGPETDALMDEAWAVVTKNRPAVRATIEVKGRAVQIPKACADAARFTFSELCGQPLGARDYLAIAARYSTIFVDHIPVLAAANRNEAKRLILLVDTLYDQRVRLIVSAAAPPDGLYSESNGTEAFEFARTASRLIEMQSREWPQGAVANEKAPEPGRVLQ